MTESDDYKDLLDGNTPGGFPLIFACMINEPEDEQAPWPLEEVFSKLLKNKMNPNQKNHFTLQYPLFYALQNKKYRSLIALLE